MAAAVLVYIHCCLGAWLLASQGAMLALCVCVYVSVSRSHHHIILPLFFHARLPQAPLMLAPPGLTEVEDHLGVLIVVDM